MLIEELLAHWRMLLALGLAGVIYFMHDQVTEADDGRDKAVAQSQVWQEEVQRQNDSLDAIRAAEKSRDAVAQRAVDDAHKQTQADKKTIADLLAAKPAPGTDMCVAASALIDGELFK